MSERRPETKVKGGDGRASSVSGRRQNQPFNRQNVNQEQPLLLAELLEQEKREQEREGGEWAEVGGGVGVGVGATVSGGGAGAGAVAPPPAPPAVALFSGAPPPQPPAPPDRPITEADHHARLLYEQWLKQYAAFAADQQRYYQDEVQKLRKIRKVSPVVQCAFVFVSL